MNDTDDRVLARLFIYAVSLVCCVVGAAALWGPAAAPFVGGVHLLIGLKLGGR